MIELRYCTVFSRTTYRAVVVLCPGSGTCRIRIGHPVPIGMGRHRNARFARGRRAIRLSAMEALAALSSTGWLHIDCIGGRITMVVNDHSNRPYCLGVIISSGYKDGDRAGARAYRCNEPCRHIYRSDGSVIRAKAYIANGSTTGNRGHGRIYRCGFPNMNMNRFTLNGNRLSCFGYLPLDSSFCTGMVTPPAIIRRRECRDILASVCANGCSANHKCPSAVIIPLRRLNLPVVDQRTLLGGNGRNDLKNINRGLYT